MSDFRDLMIAQMDDAAAAFAAEDFASGYGRGVVGRVRRRRTVRAVGVGGASVVAVGALAVGANHVPWGPLAEPAAAPDERATSPFQCGFDFPTDSQGSDDLWIDGLAWLTPAEMNAAVYQRMAQTNQAQIDRGGPAEPQPWDLPRAVGTEPGPVFTLHYPAGSEAAGGGVRDTDPVLDPPGSSSLQGPSDVIVEFSIGLTFVAVSDGVVTGTLLDPWSPQDAPHLAWVASGESSFVEPLALLNPEGAFTACPGVALESDADVYAVAGVMTDSSVDGMSGPEYAWLSAGRP